jgi:hypothetical protein
MTRKFGKETFVQFFFSFFQKNFQAQSNESQLLLNFIAFV